MITGLAAQVYPAVLEDVHAELSEQMHEVAVFTVKEVQLLLTSGASFLAVM